MFMEEQVEDRAAIDAVLAEYVQSIKAGDMDRWIKLWDPQGKQMPPGAPTRAGLVEIRKGNRPMLALFDTEMIVHPEEFQVIGDYAFVRSSYTYAMVPKEGGNTISGAGKALTILKRQVNGLWKIAIDCFNDDAPPSAF